MDGFFPSDKCITWLFTTCRLVELEGEEVEKVELWSGDNSKSKLRLVRKAMCEPSSAIFSISTRAGMSTWSA